MSNLIIPPIHQLKAELCKRRLFYFFTEFWGEINTSEYGHNWHIEFLCDKIQLVIDKYVLDRPPHIEPDKWYPGILDHISKNLVYVIPPGTTKSTILSRMAPAWLWANDPSKTWISNTIDSKNATEFSRKTIDIINSEKYQLYFPETRIRRDASAVNFYQSTKGGMRYSLTTRGSNTGKHGDVLSDDDSMDYNTAQSPSEARDCIEGWKSLQTRKKDKLKTVYILGMQRLSSFDTVAHALKSLSDVDYICLPAEDVHNNINPPELKEHYVDGLLDEKRLSREILADIKKGLNDDAQPISDIAYNIQFNQVSQTLEGLLYSGMNFVKSLPENRNGIIRLSFSDVADTGSDYFCTWFIEINQGKVYVFDAIYTQEDSKLTSPRYKNKVLQHGCMSNFMEANNQGSVYITLLHSMGVNVKGHTNTGNKEMRITSFAQFISYLNFIEPNDYTSAEYNAAVKHLQSFPKQGKASDGHDDAEDAITDAMRFIWENYRFLFQTL